jgi:hypothetical protein
VEKKRIIKYNMGLYSSNFVPNMALTMKRITRSSIRVSFLPKLMSFYLAMVTQTLQCRHLTPL